MTIGIYKIRNKTNNKVYIGQSVNVESRLKKHFYLLKNNIHENRYLQNSFNKNPEEFDYEIIEMCKIEKLNEKEVQWIKEFNSLDQEFGFNLASGGDSNFYHSESTLNKMIESSRMVNASLSVDEVRRIKMCICMNMAIDEIAELFNTEKSIVYKIKEGNASNYGWVSSFLNSKMNEPKEDWYRKNISVVIECIENKLSAREATKKCGFGYDKVLSIYKSYDIFSIKKDFIKNRNQKIVSDFDNGFKKKEILSKYSISGTQYNRILGNRIKDRKIKLINLVFDLNKESKTNTEISKILNLNRCTVSVYLKQKEQFNGCAN